jgi:hypothetical protein
VTAGRRRGWDTTSAIKPPPALDPPLATIDPGDACHLVGDGNHDELAGFWASSLMNPGVFLANAAGLVEQVLLR